MLHFIAGTIFGGFIGVITMAFCNAAKEEKKKKKALSAYPRISF